MLQPGLGHVWCMGKVDKSKVDRAERDRGFLFFFCQAEVTARIRFAANSHLADARCGFAAAGCVANRQLLDGPRLSVAIDASVSLDHDRARTIRTFASFHAWSEI